MKLNEPHVHHADELDPEFREALESTLSAEPRDDQVQASLERMASQSVSLHDGSRGDVTTRRRLVPATAASMLLCVLWLGATTETWAQVAQDFQSKSAPVSPAPPAIENPDAEATVGQLRRFVLILHVFTLTVGLAGMLLAWALEMWSWIVGKPVRLQRWLERVLLSSMTSWTVGVVLGCVWSQWTWGRIWGWDPRGAFALFTLGILVVWYIGILRGDSSDEIDNPELRRSLTATVAFWMIILGYVLSSFYAGQIHSYGYPSAAPTIVTGLFAVNLIIVLTVHLWRRKRATTSVI
jgi:hypothetical protein